MPGLGKHSRALPLTVGPAGPGGPCRSPGPQAPSGSLSTSGWPRPAAPTGMASLETGREDTRKEEWRLSAGRSPLPGHFLEPLPAGPRVTAPAHLPSPPRSHPHKAICHPRPPAGTTACDSAPSPEAALWVAVPEPWWGGRCWEGGPGLVGRGERHVQTPGGLSLSTKP